MTNQLSGRTLLAWGGRPASYCWQNLPDSARARARSPIALGALLMVAGILVLLLYMVPGRRAALARSRHGPRRRPPGRGGCMTAGPRLQIFVDPPEVGVVRQVVEDKLPERSSFLV